VACITVTNVSLPDQHHFLFANVAQLLFQPSEDRAIRALATSTVGPTIPLGSERSPDLLLAPIQFQFTLMLNFGSDEICGRDSRTAHSLSRR